MKKTEIIEHFGSVSATARALRISSQAVYKWPDIISDRIAWKVELVTKGALKTQETLKNEQYR